ncbi:hypothetical protein SAMN05216420_101213 [Nitrosospira sp. Nl5]|nr:hypothetical protein SAMN05216420_101213 [Nitrosospira sp. Nl5]
MPKFWLIFLILSTSSFAGLDEGLKAFKANDYPTAMKILTPFAEQGNANAQTKVGLYSVIFPTCQLD